MKETFGFGNNSGGNNKGPDQQKMAGMAAILAAMGVGGYFLMNQNNS